MLKGRHAPGPPLLGQLFGGRGARRQRHWSGHGPVITRHGLLASLFINRREVLAMSRAHLFESFCQIRESMKALGNLGRIGSTLPDASAISFRPVPRHDMHFWMRLKPSGDRLGQAVLEHIERAAPLEIDHDRAIAMAFAPSPIVDANDLRWWPLG
jgi:hypothetical protein